VPLGLRTLRRGCARLAALVVLAGLGTAAYVAATWPDVGALAQHDPASTAFIDRYRAACRARGEPDAVAWTWVPY
jgi:hypothetical protein